jgi:hypothetical protein
MAAWFTPSAECPVRKEGDECEKGTFEAPKERSRVCFDGFRRSCEDAPCGGTGGFTSALSVIPGPVLNLIQDCLGSSISGLEKLGLKLSAVFRRGRMSGRC